MLKTDERGGAVLQYTVTGRIRRIPLPKCGTSKKGEWRMASVFLECFEEGVNGSAQLYLVTFDDYLGETLENLGVGKDVKATFHIEVREKFDNCSISLMLDSIELLTAGENFILNGKKGGDK